MNIKQWGTLLSLAGLIAGCGTVEPEDGVKLRATVSATRKAATEINDLAKRAAIKQVAPLRAADNINFTPSKLEMYIKYLQVSIRDSERGIDIPINKWVNVATNEDLTDLVEGEVTVEKEDLGYYSEIKMEVDSVLRLTASMTIGDTTYEVTEVEASGLGGFFLSYADSFPIGGDAVVDTTGDTLYTADIPTIRVILDATGAAAVSGLPDDGSPIPDKHYVPQDSTFYVSQSLIAVPYIGTERPVVERYQITWETGWEHHLRFITVSNSEGVIQTANHRVIHSPDYRISLFEESPGLHLIPNWWPVPVAIRNDDGSWWIGNDPDFVEDDINPGEFVCPELMFPSFRAESHTGEMQYGDEMVTYTAVKLE